MSKASVDLLVRCVFCALVLLLVAPVQANFIVNGSFEDPVIPTGFAGYPTGSAAITGWTVVGPDVVVVRNFFNGTLFQAESGSQYLDVTGFVSNSLSNGVSQTVPTQIGQLYDLSFYVGSVSMSPGFFPATVDLSIDGGSRSSYFNPNTTVGSVNWMPFTVQFTATSASTNLTFFNGSAANNSNAGLDSVSLTAAVPEPLLLAPIALAAGGLAAVRRRRG